MIITWLKAQAATLAAGALLLLSIVLFVAVLNAKGETRKQVKLTDKAVAETKVVKADLAVCQGNLLTVRAAIDHQSAAVEALRAERDAAQAEGRQSMKAARVLKDELGVEIASALNRQPRSAEYCEQARELEAFLRGAIR